MGTCMSRRNASCFGSSYNKYVPPQQSEDEILQTEVDTFLEDFEMYFLRTNPYLISRTND